MSDNWLIFIPADGEFVPTAGAAEEAKALLGRLLPEAWEVEWECSRYPRFIHCGSNLQSIRCPNTGKDIDLEVWHEAMEKAFDAEWRDMQFICPCCRQQVPLDKLVYDWPQGFARFSLEAMNPGVGEFPQEQVKALAEILGCELRVIWCHV